MGLFRPPALLLQLALLLATSSLALSEVQRYSYAYLPSAQDSSIAVMRSTSERGELLHAGTIRHAEGTRRALSVHVHPAGQYAYVVHGADADGIPGVTLQRVDPRTGRLEYRSILLRSLGSLQIALSATGERVWVTDSESRSLRTFAIDPQLGTWREDHAAMPTGAGPCQILADPRGRFLFVLNRTGCSVSRYKLDARGRPELAGEEVLLNGSVPVSACLDPSGDRFFVTLETWDLLLSMTVDPRNAGLRTINAAGSGSSPGGVCFSATHNRIYAAESGGDSVSAWDVDPETGRLGARLGPYSAGQAPQHVALSPDDSFLWVTGREARVRVYALDGRMAAVETFRCGLAGPSRPIAGSAGTVTVKVETMGLCVADLERRALSILSQPSSAPAQQVDLDLTPHHIAIDPFGRWVVAAQERPGELVLVPVADSGRLGRAKRIVPVSRVLADLVSDPSGRYIAVASRTPPMLRTYRVDAAAGTLEAIHEVRLGATPDALAWDPTGRVVCVTHKGANRVSVARVDKGHFFGSPITIDVLGGPGPLAISPCGEALFVGLTRDDAILPFDLDAAAGSLTARRSLAVGTPGSPQVLRFDPSGRELLTTNLAADGKGTLCVVERFPRTGALHVVSESQVREASFDTRLSPRARAMAAATSGRSLAAFGIRPGADDGATRFTEPDAVHRMGWLERFIPSVPLSALGRSGVRIGDAQMIGKGEPPVRGVGVR